MINLLKKIYSKITVGQREKKFVQNSLYFYLSGFISYLSRFLSTIVLLRYLGAHDYGLIILTVSVVEIIFGFFSFRHHESIIKFSHESLSKGDKKETSSILISGYCLSFLVAVCTYVFIYISSPAISGIFFHQPEGKTLLRIYGVALFINSFTTVPYSIMLVFEKHRLLNFLISLLYVLRLLLPLLFISFRLKGVLSGYILAHCFVTAAFIALSGRITVKRIGHHAILARDIIKTMKWMFPFTFHTFFSETLKTFTGYSSVLILGYFRTPMEVSCFSIAQSYAGISGFFINSASPLAFNKLSQLWSDKKIKLFELALIKGRIYLLLLSFCAGIAIALPAHFAIPLLYGKEMEKAVLIGYIMILSYFYLNAYAWLRPFFLAINHPEFSTLLNIIVLPISVTCSIYFTYAYGATGTATASFLCGAVLLPLLSPWLLEKRKKIANTASPTGQ